MPLLWAFGRNIMTDGLTQDQLTLLCVFNPSGSWPRGFSPLDHPPTQSRLQEYEIALSILRLSAQISAGEMKMMYERGREVMVKYMYRELDAQTRAMYRAQVAAQTASETLAGTWKPRSPNQRIRPA